MPGRRTRTTRSPGTASEPGSMWPTRRRPYFLIRPPTRRPSRAAPRSTRPNSISPMLPDEALRRFGLGLNDASPALSFRIDVAEDGSISGVETMASTVRVKRCSYGEADLLMETGAAPDLVALAELAARRNARRVANGAVEIDIPEVRMIIESGPGSKDIRIEALPRDRSSALVREMMLLAGEAAARWAFERSLAFPFYGQEAPSDMGLNEGRQLSSEGESAHEAPRSLAVQFARRRMMRAGMRGPSPSAHRGLGLPFYAQVTSPLRRYQDLLGHMQLRAFLAGRRPLDADEVSKAVRPRSGRLGGDEAGREGERPPLEDGVPREASGLGRRRDHRRERRARGLAGLLSRTRPRGQAQVGARPLAGRARAASPRPRRRRGPRILLRGDSLTAGSYIHILSLRWNKRTTGSRLLCTPTSPASPA